LGLSRLVVVVGEAQRQQLHKPDEAGTPISFRDPESSWQAIRIYGLLESQRIDVFFSYSR
jgi:hypothetical protein